MFWSKKRSRSDEPKEPLFTAISGNDAEMEKAHVSAAASMPRFHNHVLRIGEHKCSAKLRFKDPDLSEELGEDQFLFLWLSDVHFHANEGIYSGLFFEVPLEFSKWHKVGERLGFHREDVFDWMVNNDGHLFGGYTFRVARARLSEKEWPSYDKYVGVTSWEPMLGQGMPLKKGEKTSNNPVIPTPSQARLRKGES